MMTILARPHKILDAAALEQFCISRHPDIFNEWAFSDAAEYVDFWDWLGMGEYYEILDEFGNHFRQAQDQESATATEKLELLAGEQE